MKVGDEFRTNYSSLIPGGVTVIVQHIDGMIYEYDKVKNPKLYIKAALKNPSVLKAWVKPNSSFK